MSNMYNVSKFEFSGRFVKSGFALILYVKNVIRYSSFFFVISKILPAFIWKSRVRLLILKR